MATNKIKKVGYGQVEPNRLSAQRTKEIYAQLPADETLNVIENGMALCYDQVAGKVKAVTATGKGMIGLVMNEIMLEDPSYQADSDYAMFNLKETSHQVALGAYPRIYGLYVGDTFTTNTVKIDDTHANGDTPVTKGTKFVADTDGYWVQTEDASKANVVAEVIKETTMPDGQRAIKFVITEIMTRVAEV